MISTVLWALRKAWTPLNVIFQDTPAVVTPVLLSLHRDGFHLIYLYMHTDPTSPLGPQDPWSMSARGFSPITWILWAFLPPWVL